RGRSDRGRGGLVRHSRLAAGVERGALVGREEQPAELLRTRRGHERERCGGEEEQALHPLAARSMMVMRSISHCAERRGVMVAPPTAWPVRAMTHRFTE